MTNQTKTKTNYSSHTEFDIAVIGMAGRFPQAANVDEFWLNILEGKSCISFFSETGDEQDQLLREPSQDNGDCRVRARGTLSNADHFDAFFFGVNPKEACMMDPQHRLFLEVAWNALEDANYEFEREGQKVGVFAGSSLSTYLLNTLVPAGKSNNYFAFLGNQVDQLATRTAYKLDLHGPAISVQTACSSALTAVHLACRSLIAKECDTALAGGVSIMFPQKSGYTYTPGGVFSPDGICRPFDANARGTVFSDGVGVVTLKRLNDALQDGDPIDAVIKGSAINNDGADKIGFTAPSIIGQQDVIKSAFRIADIPVESIGYIESHGTGTELGDPIEFSALCDIFGHGNNSQACALGSVKANIGHLDAAAGIAGLIKVIQILKHGIIPPQINFDEINPHINLVNSPFFITKEAIEWDKPPLHSRRACVSAFGVGGSNTHIILEEAPTRLLLTSDRRGAVLLPLSAKSEDALSEMDSQLASNLAHLPPENLMYLANSLQLGRKAQNKRLILLAEQREHGIAQNWRAFGNVTTRSPSPVYFLFEGQITNRLAEAIRWSYKNLPIFSSYFDLCSRILSKWMSFKEVTSIKALLEDSVEIQQGLVQPLLFSFEYAMSKQMMEVGVSPAGFCGHSLGEYVAACLAGVFDLETSLLLVRERGLLMSSTSAGAMLAVFTSSEILQRELPSTLEIAAINAPELIVIAGEADVVHEFRHRLDEININHKLLPTEHAFHTHLMNEVCEEFATLLRSVKFSPPKVPIVSTVTGEFIKQHEVMDPEYWIQQILEPVCFSAAIKTLNLQNEVCLIDLGPSHNLCSLANLSGYDEKRLSYVSAESQYSYERCFMKQLGILWTWGWDIKWRACVFEDMPRQVRAPTTVFKGEKYWASSPEDRKFKESHSRHNNDTFIYRPAWRRTNVLEMLPVPEVRNKGRESWLIFGEGELSKSLRSLLTEMGHLVTIVIPSDTFGKIAKGYYGINPSNSDDYDLLLKELRAFHRLPDNIAHMWLTDRDEQPPTALREMGYESLANLARAFISSKLQYKLNFLVVTENAWDIVGTEIVLPEVSMIYGPVMAIPREHPNFSTLLIDLDGNVDAPSLMRIIGNSEQLSSKKLSRLAVRYQHLWEGTIDELSVPQFKLDYINNSGFYFITGGLGGLGYAFAMHLLDAGAQVLILTRDFETASGGKKDRVQKRLQELKRFKMKVKIEIGDVASLDDVKRILEVGIKEFGRLNGVIHAAGLSYGRMLSLWDKDSAADMLRAKVEGMYILGQALRNFSLDFVVAMSSISSLVGGIGQTDYCAANLFLDAVSQDNWLPKCNRIISLNWFTWKETGMAANGAAAMIVGHRESVEAGLSTQEALEAFDEIMSSSLTGQLAISPMNPDLLNQFSPNIDTLRSAQVESDLQSFNQRPQISATYRAAEDEMQIRLLQIAEYVFGIQGLGVDDDFLELGAHSLLFAQYASEIRSAFGVEIRLHSLFEERTVAQLSLIVEELLIESIKSGDIS